MIDRPTILVVDDKPAVLDMLLALLSDPNYEVVPVHSGLEAIMRAISIQPDLILLDVMMPDVDGFDVCEQLREHPRLAEVPILMLTALDDRDSRLRGIVAGADDFISKPFDPLELQTRVKTILKLNRYRRLHVERAKFSWVVEQAADGYLIVDANDIVTYANAQARLHLNLPPEIEAIPPQTFLDLVGQQYRREPALAWDLWPESAPEQTPTYLVRPESPTAASLWLQIERIEFAAPGQNFLIRLHDVTEEMITDRLMWTFHSQISHKIRTPVTAVLGSLGLLVDKIQPAWSEAEGILLNMAYNNTVRLRDEVDAVFNYLLGANTTPAEPAWCKLASLPVLIIDTAAMLELQSVKILPWERPEVPDVALALSRHALELILSELFENAQKFHPTHSPQIDIEMVVRETTMKLLIVDDGLTLTPEQLTRIWTPYYQAEKYFTGQVAGTGLGLAMVAAMLWEVNGVCRAYNRSDRPGLIIDLTIPFRNQADADG